MPYSRSSYILSLPIALGTIALGGCVSPSTRIATNLVRYGLDRDQARCVGDRLQANLSLGQLRQLGRAAQAYGQDDATPGRLTVGDLIRVSSRIEDVNVPIQVAKAAADCRVLTGAGSVL